MDNFQIIETICETAFSTVLKCKNKRTKGSVVLKLVHQKKSDSPSKEVLRELLVLMNFKHRNLITLDSVFVHKSSVVFEMEWCVSSLSRMISNVSKPFHIGQVKKVIKSMAEGLNYLHENDIMHRDIKPANVLINEVGHVKLADFGSCRIISKGEMTPQVGTKWYKAPEMILGKKNYSYSIDIWSLGCVLAEMLILEPIFPGSNDLEMLNYIFSTLGLNETDKLLYGEETSQMFTETNYKENKLDRIFDSVDESALDLLKQMLVINYEKRITIGEVLNHPFLDEEDKYKDVNLPV